MTTTCRSAGCGATSTSTFQTPANAAIAVGILAAIPILVTGPFGGFVLSIAATGLIYLAYFMCNLGVLLARRKGWPHQPAWFNLGRWGMPVNILALVYGGLMIINIALWADQSLFGDFGNGRAQLLEPVHQHVPAVVRSAARRPAGVAAVREHRGSPCSSSGGIYYSSRVRGRAKDVESADAVTGEAVIG